MQAANRVAFNTVMMYAKMFITIGLSLYTTRLILNALGTEDFGLFNLISGIIILFSFLSNAFSFSIQRYLSYHIGAGDTEMVRTVFFTSCIIHITVALFIVVFLSTLNIFLFNGSFLNITLDRIDIAKDIYYYTIFGTFITIITSSFIALITAKEDILWIAIVSGIDAFIKFGIAIYITHSTADKLETYGFLMGLQPLSSLVILSIVCYKKYGECRINFHQPLFHKNVFKEISVFIGWTLFGNAAKMIKDQGIAVVFNVFFGTIINAAYGIANQISNQLNFFSGTLQGTINPQITKSEGCGNRERTLNLSIFASKIGFFLLAIIAIPTIFEMKILLTFWLKNVPNYTFIFCVLILISKLVEQLTSSLNSTFIAIGNIKYYQIITGTLTLLNLPLAYLLLKKGFSSDTILYFCILIEIMIGISRLFFLKLLGGISISNSISRLIKKEIIMILLPLIGCYCIYFSIEDGLFRIILMYSISSILFILCFLFLSINTNEKKIIINIIDSFRKKVFKKIKYE